jgi:hypothetical protein
MLRLEDGDVFLRSQATQPGRSRQTSESTAHYGEIDLLGK